MPNSLPGPKMGMPGPHDAHLMFGLRLRQLATRIFYRINPGDITIRHHYTREKIRLHSFRHKGYWAHGRSREKFSMRLYPPLIRQGDLIVEVGGHIGYISTYFAKLTGPEGRVLVFEPGPNNLPYIRKNIAAYANITLIDKAAADFVGTAHLHVETFSGQNNSLLDHNRILEANLRHAGLRDVPAYVVEVPCTTVDSALAEAGLPAPSFVKIDVEGAELSVLRGMAVTLRHDDVALMVEVTEDHALVYGLLKDHGYSLFDDTKMPIVDARTIDGNVFCLRKNSPRANLFKDWGAEA